MFEAVRRHQRLFLGIVLLLIIPSFVVVGAWDLISPGSDAATVAKVGKQKIQLPQWERAHQQSLEQIRAQFGGKLDPSLLDTTAARQSTLNDLVTQQVLLASAIDFKIRVADSQMRRAISAIPAVQKDGKFDLGLYQQALKAQGLTVEGFEQQMRADLMIEVLPAAIAGTTIVPRSVAKRLAQGALETRSVRIRRFSASELLAAIVVSDAEIDTFYQANLNQFQTPEEIDISLVAFSKPGSADSVELFSNLVYEQSDTLEPAAKKLNLPVQSIQGVRRQGLPAERVGKLAPELQRVISNPKFLQAVFSTDTLVNKRNTEAVEIAPGLLASARVVAHRPAAPIALATVRTQVEQQLRSNKALEKATQSAQEAFNAATKVSSVELASFAGLSTTQTVSRAGSQNSAVEVQKTTPANSKAAPGNQKATLAKQKLSKEAPAREIPSEVLSAIFSAELKAAPKLVVVPASARTEAAWLIVIESSQVPAVDSAEVKDLAGREFSRLLQASLQDGLDRWVAMRREVVGVKLYPEKVAKSETR